MCKTVSLDIKARKPSQSAMNDAMGRWNLIMKPLGSLGEFEKMIVKLAGIYGTADFDIKHRCVLVACSDNGVVSERVTQSESAVTAIIAKEMALAKSNINVMARAVDADTFVIDMGMAEEVKDYAIIDMHVRRGTDNIAKGPAMSIEEAVEAVKRGIALVERMTSVGYQVVVTGECGIGNTTTASALAAVILDMDPAAVTGRGAGLSSEMLRHKIEVVRQAIEVNQATREDPLLLLSKLGGFDIAAMVGMFLGGAIYGVPVIIDGFISSVAANLAWRLEPLAKEYMLASHLSEEKGAAFLQNQMGLKSVLHAGMRLGEGTGGVCLLPLLDIAMAEFKKAHRFSETDLKAYVELI